MPNPPRELDPRLGAVFRVADPQALGHSRNRMRARDLERPFHGVRRRVAGHSPTDGPLARDREEHDRVVRAAHACLPVAPRGAFLVGRSAAAAWSLPCPASEDLCVGVLAPQRAPRRPGVRGRKVCEHLVEIRRLDGLPVSSPATTWAMLGEELTHRELVILGDAIVCIPRDDRGRPRPELQRATPDQLMTAAWARGRRRRSALRDALAEIRVGSMSPLETDLRLLCARAGLPDPVLDVEIRDDRGRLVGIADAVYPRYRTIVEVEGDHHRTDRAQWRRDIEKHAAYVRLGYEVVRIVGSQVRGAAPPAPAIVREVLLRHGWRP